MFSNLPLRLSENKRQNASSVSLLYTHTAHPSTHANTHRNIKMLCFHFPFFKFTVSGKWSDFFYISPCEQLYISISLFISIPSIFFTFRLKAWENICNGNNIISSIQSITNLRKKYIFVVKHNFHILHSWWCWYGLVWLR